MNVKERVYGIVDEKGLKLTKVAEKAKVSRDTIARWDKVSPTLDKLQSVADALEVDIVTLIKD